MFKLLNSVGKDAHFVELIQKASMAFILRVVGAALGFLLNVYIAKQLGANEYGLYVLAFTLVTVLCVFSRLGMDSVIVRNIAASKEKNEPTIINGTINAVLQIVALNSLIILFIYFFIGTPVIDGIFGKPVLTVVMDIMILLLPLLAFIYVYSEALKGLRDITGALVSQNILVQGIALFSIMILGFYISVTIFYVVWVFVFSHFLALLYVWRRWIKKRPVSNAKLVSRKKLIVSGWPLLWASAGGLVLAWSDTIVLGVFEESDAIGVYSAALKLAMLTSFLLTAVNTIAAPKFSALNTSNNLIGLAKLARQSVALMSLLVLPVCLVLIIFPIELLSLFGTEFIAGENVLIILVVGQFFNVSSGSVMLLLITCGHEHIVKNIMLGAAVINIVLNVILVQVMGIEGVALATAISTILWNGAGLMAVRKKIGFWTIPFTKYAKSV